MSDKFMLYTYKIKLCKRQGVLLILTSAPPANTHAGQQLPLDAALYKGLLHRQQFSLC